MNKLKAIIVDDEQGSIDSLIWELDNFSDDIEVIASSQSPKQAIILMKELRPDVLFLDIQMPELNGFEFLQAFPVIDFYVVFTTAFDKYAIKAFKVNALDYLLKPIDEEELGMAIRKIKESQKSSGLSQKIESILEAFRQFDIEQQRVILPTIDGLEFIEIENIIRCESDSNYTNIHLIGEKPLLVAKTLKEVEELLEGKGFCRIHHSHLINLKQIKKYHNGKSGTIILKNGSEIPVSRSRKKDFRNHLR